MLDTKKFRELDLVELLEDLPEYNLKKGEIGVVVEVFDTASEAYDLEFVDESGRSSRFGYSVRPDQIKASDERKRKADLRDVVEVAEDLTEYGVTRGERGVVVEVFDEPEEGYILEFVDPSGMSSKLAYWVKPDQIKRVAPRKAQELEVVELAEDLPEYGVKKGERAVVTTAFSGSDEAYDLEFVDESGQSRFAYSVKPQQIINVNASAKEAFERGVSLLNAGSGIEAEIELRKAIEIRPDYVADVHNLLVSSFGQASDFRTLIRAMRFVLRLNPDFTMARSNLAIAYENLGVECAKQDNLMGAIDNFITALGVEAPVEVLSGISRNLVTAYTALGTQALQSGDVHKAVAFLGLACAVQPSEVTRHNHAAAHAHLASFYLREGEFREAIYIYEKVIDIGLSSRDVMNNYGIALAQAGEADEAVRVFEGLLHLDPQDELAQANLRSICHARESGGALPNFDTVEVVVQFAPISGMQLQAIRLAA